jgi:PAS domain S-box-containing protein
MSQEIKPKMKLSEQPEKQVSMSRGLTLSLVLAMTLVSVLVATGFYLFTANKMKQDFDRKVEKTLSYLDGTLGPVLWNFDHDTAVRVAETVLRDDLVVGVVIKNDKGKSIFSIRNENGKNIQVRTQPIHFQNETVGQLELVFSRALLSSTLNGILLISLSVWFLAVLSITIFTHLFIRKYFRGPLASFVDLAQSYHDHLEPTSLKTTQFIEFQPIEEVVKELANDVTTQLRELRKSEEKYRRIFESVEDGYILTDMDGTILSVNPATAKILNYESPSQLEGKNIAQDVYADPANRESLKLALTKWGTLKDHLLEFRTQDKKVISAECNINLVRNEGSLPIAIEGTIRDVTERNQARAELDKYREHLEELVESRTAELSIANEQLKELDKLKSMFIASMSHELRTPLNSIIGFSGLMLKKTFGELNDKHRDYTERVNKAGLHLLQLISDVIDISKVEAGRADIFPSKFLLNEMVTEAIDLIRPQADIKGLTLEVNVPQGIEMNTDRRRLYQCLLNFISNAVKYSEKGCTTVTAEKRNDQIRLEVTDTGIGIPEANHSQIFEAFERVESHLKILSGGTGLGLYLTYKIVVEILQGSIGFDSKEGEGSRFWLEVPLVLDYNNENITQKK